MIFFYRKSTRSWPESGRGNTQCDDATWRTEKTHKNTHTHIKKKRTKHRQHKKRLGRRKIKTKKNQTFEAIFTNWKKKTKQNKPPPIQKSKDRNKPQSPVPEVPEPEIKKSRQTALLITTTQKMNKKPRKPSRCPNYYYFFWLDFFSPSFFFLLSSILQIF